MKTQLSFEVCYRMGVFKNEIKKDNQDGSIGKEDSGSTSGKPSSFRQIIVAIIACLGCWCNGIALGYSTVALPTMQIDPVLMVTDEEASWITSFVSIGGMIGSLLSGPIMNRYGRKKTLIYFCTLSCLIGWCFIIAAKPLAPIIGKSKAIVVIITGRLIGGLAMGSGITVAPVYIIEMVTPELVEQLGPIAQVFRTVSYLVVILVGSYLDWYYLAISFAVTLMPIFIAELCLPESPIWLAAVKKDLIAAEKSLIKARGKNCDHSAMLKEFTLLSSKHVTVSKGTTRMLNPGEEYPVDLKWRELLIPMIISIGLMLFNQLTGITLFYLYIVQLFQLIDDNLDPYVWSIGVASLQAVTSFGTVLLTKWFSSKTILLSSSIMVAVSLFGLAVHFHMSELGWDCNLPWLPLCSMVLFVISYGIGYGPLLYPVGTAILPQRTRDIGSAVVIALNWVFGFFVGKLFVDMRTYLHSSGLFYFYGIGTVFGILFISVFIPRKLIADKRNNSVCSITNN